MNIERKKFFMQNLISSHSLSKNMTSKLELINEYVSDIFTNVDVVYARDLDDLMDLCELDWESDNFEDLNNIFKKYSGYRGNPYYIYIYEFVNGNTYDEMCNRIHELSTNRHSITEDFDIELINSTIDEYLIKLNIKLYKYNLIPNINGTKVREESEIAYKKVSIYIYTISSKIFIKTGDSRYANLSYKFLVSELHDIISLKPLRINNCSVNTIPCNDLVNSSTIYMLELCLKHLNNYPNHVHTHKNVKIKNPSADKLKILNASGNNLFHDRTIYEKIKEGAIIKAVTLLMTWYNQQTNSGNNIELQVYIEGTVKITINKPQNSRFNLDIIDFISTQMINLLGTTINIPNGQALPYFFGEILLLVNRNKITIINELMTHLLKNNILNENKDIITQECNNYIDGVS